MDKVSLIQCDCGLVITSPRPTVSEIGAYYPPTYYSYTPTAPSVTRRIVDKVKEYKGGYPTKDGFLARMFWRSSATILQNLFLFHLPYQGNGQRLLEIGCGSGLNLQWAREHGWDVYGLELSEGAVTEAHRQGFANVQCANIEDAEFPAEFFDAVLVNHTLEHLYSPIRPLPQSGGHAKSFALVERCWLRYRSSTVGRAISAASSGQISIRRATCTTSPSQFWRK